MAARPRQRLQLLQGPRAGRLLPARGVWAAAGGRDGPLGALAQGENADAAGMGPAHPAWFVVFTASEIEPGPGLNHSGGKGLPGRVVVEKDGNQLGSDELGGESGVVLEADGAGLAGGCVPVEVRGLLGWLALAGRGLCEGRVMVDGQLQGLHEGQWRALQGAGQQAEQREEAKAGKGQGGFQS